MEALQRKDRFVNNALIRKEGREQTRRAAFNRLECQCFIGKTLCSPSIVQLHPYSQQIVVAYRDRVMLNDWNRSVITSLSPIQVQANQTIQTTTNKRGSNAGRVTSVQFINAHDRGMVMAGYDDGVVRLFLLI